MQGNPDVYERKNADIKVKRNAGDQKKAIEDSHEGAPPKKLGAFVPEYARIVIRADQFDGDLDGAIRLRDIEYYAALGEAVWMLVGPDGRLLCNDLLDPTSLQIRACIR